MMRFLFLFLFLTACGQKTENAKPEASAKNITNIALAKYEAREELTEEEYLSLRKPVPDWETYKRLVRAEDGFDDLRRFYLATNIIAPNLDWNSIVYYDPQQESYYHGVFKPTNINGWQDLINTKKDPAREIYGRDRVVLITNISPSLHIYADAYNDYKFYELELKSTIDEYGFVHWDPPRYFEIYQRINQFRLPIKWKATTNTFLWSWGRISYVATTNGVSVVDPSQSQDGISSFISRLRAFEPESSNRTLLYAELTNTNKPDIIANYDGKKSTISYTEETKSIYYAEKYGFFGDISLLTNENPPMITNYYDWRRTTKDIFQQYDEENIVGDFERSKYGALDITI